MSSRRTRREVLLLGASALAGCAGVSTRKGAACAVSPALTEGPFWVDEKLARADLTTDSRGRAACAGLPLTLHIAVSRADCSVLSGAQVDVWHCDAAGSYSDADNMGEADTHGRDFLRGYQLTDDKGSVAFRTIYPGWYHGRTVHIHVKVRLFDGAGKVTTLATTQLFFDDATTDRVHGAHAAYQGHGARDLRNADDDIYGGHRELLCTLDGDAQRGVVAHASLGVAVGVIEEEHGPPGGPHGPGGTPPWGRPPRRPDQ